MANDQTKKIFCEQKMNYHPMTLVFSLASPKTILPKNMHVFISPKIENDSLNEKSKLFYFNLNV